MLLALTRCLRIGTDIARAMIFNSNEENQNSSENDINRSGMAATYQWRKRQTTKQRRE